MLRLWAVGVFLLACIGAAVSILAQWPHQFMGQGNPDRVPEEFLFIGTLLAPPLPLLLPFGASAFLVRREDRVGFIATVGMIPMLTVMIVGSLGEVLSAPSQDVPRFAQVAGGLIGATAFFTLLVLVVRRVGPHRPTG
jgi:hypothetical protein